MFNYFEKTGTQIQHEVMNELRWNPSVTDTQINVTAKNGVVTPRGSVPYYFNKSSAEEATQRVGGVRAVADEIEIDMMGSHERSDGDIADAPFTSEQFSYCMNSSLENHVKSSFV